MPLTYAVTGQKLRELCKGKEMKKLELMAHDTDMVLIPNQNWGDVGYFTPPIKAVYLDHDPSLPTNYSVKRRDGHFYRGIIYAVISDDVAERHGVKLLV